MKIASFIGDATGKSWYLFSLYSKLIYMYRRSAEELSATNPKDADNYHYFSYDTKSGTSGIARGVSFGGGKGSGTFCLKTQKSRTAISEWMSSDAKTSLVRLIFSWLLYLYLLKPLKSNRPLNKFMVSFLDICAWTWPRHRNASWLLFRFFVHIDHSKEFCKTW